MIEGDKILYVYNNPWMNNNKLIGATGILKSINTFDFEDGGQHHPIGFYYLCDWTSKAHVDFSWWVPKNHVRKLKQSEL